LNELINIIQNQQDEIQKLKQELEQQKTITIQERKVNKEEIKEIVKTQMEKKGKGMEGPDSKMGQQGKGFR